MVRGNIERRPHLVPRRSGGPVSRNVDTAPHHLRRRPAEEALASALIKVGLAIRGDPVSDLAGNLLHPANDGPYETRAMMTVAKSVDRMNNEICACQPGSPAADNPCL